MHDWIMEDGAMAGKCENGDKRTMKQEDVMVQLPVSNVVNSQIH